jgi:hypothetical protein
MSKIDKPQELVINHVSRTLSKLFAWAGVILSVLMVILYVAAPGGSYNLDVRFMGLCVVVAVISPLSLYSLSANKPLLETSDEGIMAGGLVRWYCPWSNVKNIAISNVERKIKGGLFLPALTGTFKELVIEIHSPDDVYYDNWLHKALRDLVVKDGGIILSVERQTSLAKDQVCKILFERWQQALGQTRESRA